MAGASRRIPSTFIDDLLARVDIVDVVEPRVRLRQRGRNLFGRCPFHEEKTPSFSVSREKQIYYCFGCRASGTAITFLMEFDGLGFVDTVEELAARVGMEVPRTGPGPDAGPGRGRSGDLEPVYAALDQANRYFLRQLREHSERTRAVEYLKSRGVTGEFAARFELGFAPPGWEGLRSSLGDAGADALERAGLVIRRDTGGHYDRFRDRVMFPIRDRRGRVVGFGGRIIGEGEPKYLNSPEGPVFHKGRELYGQYQVLRGRGGRPSRLVVVEGYMDVVAVAQFGIDYAVATLGTAATRDHLRELYRSTREVVFCFDGDAAGRDAAWRALEQALPLMRDGRQASFSLPARRRGPRFVRAVPGSGGVRGGRRQGCPAVGAAVLDPAGRGRAIHPGGTSPDRGAGGGARRRGSARRLPGHACGPRGGSRPGGARGGPRAGARRGEGPAAWRRRGVRLGPAAERRPGPLAGPAGDTPASATAVPRRGPPSGRTA